MASECFDVFVLGGCVMDFISYTPRFPKPGESVRGRKFLTVFGGKGANQAVAASRLGAKVSMIGMIGDDKFGGETIENFKNEKINVDFLQKSTDGTTTGTASIFVDDNGENCIVMNMAANESITVENIFKAENAIKNSKVFVTQLECPVSVTLEALKLAKKNDVFTIFSPAPGIENLSDEFLAYADIVCPNENEAEILTGIQISSIEDAKIASEIIIKKGAQICIITLGAQGCVVRTKNDPKNPNDPFLHHIEAPKVKAVDTAGAGDSFLGSLAFYFSAMPQLSLIEKIRRACVIAAHSVQHPGTQTSFPHRQNLDPSLFA